MNRREFIALVGGATAWPLKARAQQSAVPVVGFLSGVSLESYADRFGAFRQGLKDAGFIEGQNVTIEYRSAHGQYLRLPELAADLVLQKVAVIVAVGSAAPARAARGATSTIPIVFVLGTDPVAAGLVTSFSRPEVTAATATGVW
jgi:putative ABC transport system substrate-binding protein